MIEISYDLAITLYLSVTLLAIFLIALRSHFVKKRRSPLVEYKLYVCEYCQHPYLEDPDTDVTKCPECGLFNKFNIYKSKSNL